MGNHLAILFYTDIKVVPPATSGITAALFCHSALAVQMSRALFTVFKQYPMLHWCTAPPPAFICS